MMQRPRGLDDVETAIDAIELQQIGLRILDRKAERMRLARRVAKTDAAEIDREKPGADKLALRLDWMHAGAATRDQDLRTVGEVERPKRSEERRVGKECR